MWGFLFGKKKKEEQKQSWYERPKQDSWYAPLRGVGMSGAEFKRIHDAAVERRPNVARDGYGFQEAWPSNHDHDSGVTLLGSFSSDPDPGPSHGFDGGFGGGGYSGSSAGGSWDNTTSYSHNNDYSSNDYSSSNDSNDYSSSDSGSTNWD